MLSSLTQHSQRHLQKYLTSYDRRLPTRQERSIGYDFVDLRKAKWARVGLFVGLKCEDVFKELVVQAKERVRLDVSTNAQASNRFIEHNNDI